MSVLLKRYIDQKEILSWDIDEYEVRHQSSSETMDKIQQFLPEIELKAIEVGFYPESGYLMNGGSDSLDIYWPRIELNSESLLVNVRADGYSWVGPE